jgi:hypothetical protein
MRSRGNAHTIRGLIALALVLGAGGGCFALGIEFEQTALFCDKKEDCPYADDACGVWACKQGYCEFTAKEAPKDGNPCTADKCVQGKLEYVNEPKGYKCGAGDKLTCDGEGSCVGCKEDSECLIKDPCAVWTCNVPVCTRILKAEGTPAGDETQEDCKTDYCSTTGQPEPRPDAADVKNNKNECTTDACDNGTPINPNVLDGTKCDKGCKTCTGGICGGCSPGYVCNTMVDACVPLQQLPNGSACTFTTDCASGNCVDGVCCDSACTSPCMACGDLPVQQRRAGRHRVQGRLRGQLHALPRKVVLRGLTPVRGGDDHHLLWRVLRDLPGFLQRVQGAPRDGMRDWSGPGQGLRDQARHHT